MKFFADFTSFSARYCDIAVRGDDCRWQSSIADRGESRDRRRSYGRRAINSKQYLAENRLFRQSKAPGGINPPGTFYFVLFFIDFRPAALPRFQPLLQYWQHADATPQRHRHRTKPRPRLQHRKTGFSPLQDPTNLPYLPFFPLHG